jgi:hypothetical protein
MLHKIVNGSGLERAKAFMAGVTLGLPAGFCATSIAIP